MAAEGIVVPALQNQPDLPEDLMVCYHLFHDLAGDRQQGFSLGPIPWTAFKDWCVFHGITSPDNVDELWEIVAACDAEVLKKANKTKPGPPPRAEANQNAEARDGSQRTVPSQFRGR